MDETQHDVSSLIFLKESFDKESPYLLLDIYQAFGLSKLQAQTALNNTVAIRISSELLSLLHNISTDDWIPDKIGLQAALFLAVEHYSIDVLYVNGLVVTNIVHNNSSEITQTEFDYLYAFLSEYFPDKFNQTTIEVKCQDGRVFNLSTEKIDTSEKIKQFISLYSKWFTDNQRKMTPLFKEIKEEIGTYLTNNYDGISPSEVGFMRWFISTKLGKATIEFEIEKTPVLGPDEWRIVGVNDNLTINSMQPLLVEQHLHEYCDWRLQQQNSVKSSSGQAQGRQTVKEGMTTPAHKSEPPLFSRFQDLFNDQVTLDTCVELLRSHDPPLINLAGQWVKCKGNKSVLIAWIERLEYCGRIRRVDDRQLLVTLLNGYFPNLNMGMQARQFSDRNQTYEAAKRHFAILIPRVLH